MQVSRQSQHSSKKAPHFRIFLQNELIRRCESNRAYSLRAFAKSLGLHHTTLSRLLNEKRPPNPKLIEKICAALKLSPQEVEQFKGQAQAGRKIEPYSLLTVDLFNCVSEWYHDAILELTHIKDFKGDIKWVARTLGITRAEAAAAVERLIRLELLEITRSGEWIDISRNNTTNVTNDFSSVALRKLQKKILELSIEALEELPRDVRDHTSMTVAIDQADLPEVKERIRQFRYELTEFLQRKKANSVFQLAISFFPLTKTTLEGDES